MADISIFAKKKASGDKITMMTCYDYSMAKIVEQAGIDAILVGDSLGMVMQGNSDTLSVTVDDIIYHTKAVRKGAPTRFIVADMPYLSYQISPEDAVRNAGRILKESGANAVKVEGGKEIVTSVKAMIAAKIPVMGHLGLTPQSVNVMGGYKVQGKTEEAALQLLDDAFRLQEAGVFSITLECVPHELAKIVEQQLNIPVIGIGCGSDVSGQVLVIQDALGLNTGKTAKFVKKYADLASIMQNAVANYIKEVQNQQFPEATHTYLIDKAVIENINKKITAGMVGKFLKGNEI